MVGPDDLRGFFQPKFFYGSMKGKIAIVSSPLLLQVLAIAFTQARGEPILLAILRICKTITVLALCRHYST